MRTGWEILPDGEFCGFFYCFCEEQIKERFRRRKAARTSDVFDSSQKDNKKSSR